MSSKTCNVLILGGGMVGLSIAHQLLERSITSDITILDKEAELGCHSSGRNSGVLHAGLYYTPGSLKSKVCRCRCSATPLLGRGASITPLNPCGKVIVPQRVGLDAQLDVLAERGKANGAKVEFWDENQLRALIPEARTASGRALWSPNTAVVKPIEVIKRLQQELTDQGVQIIHCGKKFESKPEEQELKLFDGTQLSYGHLFNCTGLQADRIAQLFGVGEQYTLLPFKGIYWQLKADCPIQPRTNLYPVPDLNVPFLGVHFSPSADATPVVSIGPTATPAFGRENYKGLDSFEPVMAAKNIGGAFGQYLANQGGFRRYVHEQAFLALPPLLIRAAQELIPAVKDPNIELSQKVGIRSQLFNRQSEQLEDDFLCLPGTNAHTS